MWELDREEDRVRSLEGANRDAMQRGLGTDEVMRSWKPQVTAMSVRPTSIKDPKLPSKQEIADHNMTHLPFRSWCRICVEARGRGRQHRRLAHDVSKGNIPRLTMD